MNKLTESLQNNPIIILIMFILTLISSVVTLILGWDKFYTSFLAKEFSIPVWALLLLTLIGAVLYIFRNKKIKKSKEFTTVEGETYGVQAVEMDGMNFVNCTFDGSELVFRGTDGFNLTKNNFETPPRLSFQGYAASTLMVLKALNKEPMFKPTIQKTFE